MPQRRLPWFKVWVGATRHEKVVQLEDRAFRAWIELLDAASEQPVRGRFTSCAAAAAIIRRPPALVRRLAEARLIDEREDGIWLHDWPEWQRWRPEDDPPDGPPTTREQLVKNNGTTHEPHANGTGRVREKTRPRVERAKRETEKGDVDEEKDGELIPPAANAAVPPSKFSDAERDLIAEVEATLAPFGFALRPEFWRKVLDEYGRLPLGMEAHKQADWLRRNHKRACNATRYTNWLARALQDRQGMVVQEEQECRCAFIHDCDAKGLRNGPRICPEHGFIERPDAA